VEYRDAGVDIDAYNAAMRSLKERIRSTFGPDVLADVGHFGGLYALPGDDRRALVATTDGLGTKVLLYAALGRHDRVGEDLVSHCINDIAVLGALPLFFLDYLAGASLPPQVLVPLLGGFADSCRAHGIALLGGETAEMPGMYPVGRYDVAGFLLGIVDRDRVLDGSAVRAGDAILGFASNGLHTNGYSLARRALLGPGRRELEEYVPDLAGTLADALLRPHLCYLEPIRTLHDARLASAFAHITGGGLVDNVPRVLPPACDALIRKGAWEIPEIFGLIQAEGSVPEEEMYRAFNMGIGLAAMVPAEFADEALRLLQGKAKVIGEIVPGTGTVRFG
jgi:phosphoribosylformylglycinamidine cyclo-ligase